MNVYWALLTVVVLLCEAQARVLPLNKPRDDGPFTKIIDKVLSESRGQPEKGSQDDANANLPKDEGQKDDAEDEDDCSWLFDKKSTKPHEIDHCFNLTKIHPNEDKGDITAGDKIGFRLVIQIPVGASSETRINFGSTPEGLEVMSMENVKVTTGQHISLTGSTTVEKASGPYCHGRAGLNLGVVTNTGETLDLVESRITVEWDAIAQDDMDDLDENEEVGIFVGVVWNCKGNEVNTWVDYVIVKHKPQPKFHVASDWEEPEPESQLKVDEVTFTMKKGIPEQTEIMVGSVIHFTFTIQIPEHGTHDMVAELFTPDNDTTVMKLANVRVVKGRLLETTGSIEPVLEGKTPDDTDYDRAILELGSVTNVGGAERPEDSMFIVEWDAVVLAAADAHLKPDQVVWVSAGVEYNNEMEVWVGQAGFTYKKDPLIGVFSQWPEPTFSFTAPDTVVAGETAVFRLDVHMAYPMVDVVVEVLPPEGPFMTPCSVSLIDTGDYFSHVEKEDVSKHYEPSRPCGGGSLQLKGLVNAGSRLPETQKVWEKNRLTFEYHIFVHENDTNVGNTFWVGASVEMGPSQFWVGQKNVTVVKRQGPAPVVMPKRPDFKFETIVGGDYKVAMGEEVDYHLTIDFPVGSVNDYRVMLITQYSAEAADMSIEGVETLNKGLNIPCTTTSQPVYNKVLVAAGTDHDFKYQVGGEDRQVHYSAEWNLTRITNTGHFKTDPKHNQITYLIRTRLLHQPTTPDKKVWFMASVSYAHEQIWVGQNAIVVDDASEQIWVGQNAIVVDDASENPNSNAEEVSEEVKESSSNKTNADQKYLDSILGFSSDISKGIDEQKGEETYFLNQSVTITAPPKETKEKQQATLLDHEISKMKDHADEDNRAGDGSFKAKPLGPKQTEKIVRENNMPSVESSRRKDKYLRIRSQSIEEKNKRNPTGVFIMDQKMVRLKRRGQKMKVLGL